MQPRAGWLRRSVIALLVACVADPLVRVCQVHDEGWEWRPTPSAAPPRLLFDERSYLRRPHITPIPSADTAHWETPGGHDLRRQRPRTDTVIYVEADRQTYDYVLQGGP